MYLLEFFICSGLEPRLLTRFDCRRYAREAYELGVRYIGGCCGFEPHHIREAAEEVSSSPAADFRTDFFSQETLPNYLPIAHTAFSPIIFNGRIDLKAPKMR